MQGARMDVVKAAAIELLRQLKPDDVFSIVVFSDRAEVMVPASRNLDRKMIESQIRMIRPGGGTEIFQGLETGMAEVNRHSSRSLVNHIILITDGWTYGDEEDCLQLAEQAASQGIGITGMGLGVEWNDYFMDELTKRTGGNSTYIARDDDFRGFLQEKINNLNQIFGDRVILNLETGPDVKLNSIYRLQPETAELSSNSPIRVGNILKSTPLSILMEFVVPPIPTDVKRFMLASGDLNMVLPSEPARPKKMAVKLSRLTDQEKKVEEPPRPIYQAVSQVTLYRMQERARQNVAQGKIQEASMCLQRLATQLMAIGERELANTALTEAERIQKTHMFSLEGAKEIKYGTRALLPSGLESRML
jgi:Ca-activated chloride channel family protein